MSRETTYYPSENQPSITLTHYDNRCSTFQISPRNADDDIAPVLKTLRHLEQKIIEKLGHSTSYQIRTSKQSQSRTVELTFPNTQTAFYHQKCKEVLDIYARMLMPHRTTIIMAYDPNNTNEEPSTVPARLN